MKKTCLSLDDLCGRASGWLSASGDYAGMVISSRARLARNLADLPFPQRATNEEQARVVEAVLTASQRSDALMSASFFEAGKLDGVDRQFLVERHLISLHLAEQDWPCGVFVREDETISVMVNEEDHLRIQTMRPGFQPEAVWELADRVDEELSESLDVAFSKRWGYLTACPTNTGTGLRVSALIHLPGLVLTREIEAALRGVRQLGFAVRGLHGEGTEIIGNLLQISNQVTLGVSEQETVALLRRVIDQVIRCEEDAREALIRDAKAHIEDKVWRAYGILTHARMLTSQEYMNLASAVKFGLFMGILKQPNVAVMNELMVLTQPSHLQKLAGHQLEPPERDVFRASFVQQRIA
ncbi:MAG: protein arginine kinase [Candidatus Latescibacteria bacterium]|nr:protein arginine kinase [Candidatus Latescibacterota bacterium]